LQPKTIYWFSLVPRDSSGRWGDTMRTACDTARTLDRQPPDNKIKPTATALSDTSAQLVWNTTAIDSADADSVGIWNS
jgi:hypothetical protein